MQDSDGKWANTISNREFVGSMGRGEVKKSKNRGLDGNFWVRIVCSNNWYSILGQKRDDSW